MGTEGAVRLAGGADGGTVGVWLLLTCVVARRVGAVHAWLGAGVCEMVSVTSTGSHYSSESRSVVGGRPGIPRCDPRLLGLRLGVA